MRRIKFILCPNNEQKQLLDLNIECAIVAYNWAVETNRAEYANNRKILLQNVMSHKVAMLKDDPEFWRFNNCSSQVLNNSIKELYDRYQEFFQTHDKSRLPKFRNLNAEEVYMGFPSGKVSLYLAISMIFLPKIGWVKLGGSFQDSSNEIQRKFHVGYTRITRKDDVYTAEITMGVHYDYALAGIEENA